MTSAIQPDSSNLPLPKKGMPKWGQKYLEALQKCSGVKTKAAALINLSYSAVYKVTLSQPDFGDAVDKIRAEWIAPGQGLLGDQGRLYGLGHAAFEIVKPFRGSVRPGKTVHVGKSRPV